MFKHLDFYLPDGEVHWIQNDLHLYQEEGRREAYKYVTNWTYAIDAGANIGIFSRAFAARFVRVLAFEPMPSTRECLERNVPANVTIVGKAVGDAPSIQHMHQIMKGSGGAFIYDHPDIPALTRAPPKPERSIEVAVVTIDSFGLDGVGLIKLDIQGAEYLALRGAERTIRRCRPVILMEEKPRPNDPADQEASRRAADFLLSLGMTQGELCRGDRIYLWGDPT